MDLKKKGTTVVRAPCPALQVGHISLHFSFAGAALTRRKESAVLAYGACQSTTLCAHSLRAAMTLRFKKCGDTVTALKRALRSNVAAQRSGLRVPPQRPSARDTRFRKLSPRAKKRYLLSPSDCHCSRWCALARAKLNFTNTVS